jgi:glutathione S-transferase
MRFRDMATETGMTLYDFPDSPSARRARMLLAEKGLVVQKVTIDLRAGEHLSEAYLRINPAGLVPALRLSSGEVITENDGIAAYVDAAWREPPLLGTTPLARGRVLQWNARLELEGLLPVATFLRNSHPAFKGRALPGLHAYAQIPELADRSRSQAAHFLPVLNEQLSQSEYFAGPEFSFADITAIVFLDLYATAGLLVDPSFVAIRQWAHRVWQRPSYSR